MKKVVPRLVAYAFLKRLQNSNVLFRQCVAEFLGTFVLIALINSALAVGILTGNHQTLLYASFAGGVGLYLGFIIAGTVHVGHLNPAVTIALVSVKKASWKAAPLYIICQLCGAFLASVLVYFQYLPYLMNVKNEPAKITLNLLHSSPGISSTLTSTLIDQITCVGILMIALLALTDKCNTNNGKFAAPLGFIFVLASLIMSYGIQGCAINPARELAGRLFSTIIGLGENSFAPMDNLFWLVSGILGPIIGGLLGSWIYYLLVEIHQVDEDIQTVETDVGTQTANPDKKETSNA